MERPGSKFVVYVLGAALAATATACSSDKSVLSTGDGGSRADPCRDVSCTVHGTCAVVEGASAVCLCDPGYHADGLECVENEAGQECNGVDCSGHGTCVVVQGDPDYPLCLCDEGYKLMGKTNCVKAESNGTCGPGTVEIDGQCVAKHPCAVEDCTPDICNSSADCDPGQVCVFETGECVDASDFQCEPPPDLPQGDRSEYERCGIVGDEEHWCEPGFRCVPEWLVMNYDGEYVPGFQVPSEYEQNLLSGVCAPSCNPCEGDCPDGRLCIGLEDGGGFCSARRLASEDQLCLSVGGNELLLGWCEAGTICYPAPPPGGGDSTDYAGKVNSFCKRYCVPDIPEAWSLGAPGGGGATTSRDCDPGEICVFSAQRPGGSDWWGHIWFCLPGRLVPMGGPCLSEEGIRNDYETIRCEYPAWCRNGVNDALTFLPGSGTCTHTKEDCPPPAHWRFEGHQGIPGEACVLPGAVRYGGYCEEDVDCAPGLTCQDWDHDPEGFKHCLD